MAAALRNTVTIFCWAALLATPVSAQTYTIIDLGLFRPLGINRSGVVVGASPYDAENNAFSPFIYESRTGVMTVLQAPQQSWFGSGYDINRRGQIVGIANLPDTGYAFLYERGVLANIGGLGGFQAGAFAINDKGVVVGYSYLYGLYPLYRAFAYDASSQRMTALPTLGGSNSVAYDINKSGVIVGGASLPNDAGYHAFRFTKRGGIEDLGTLVGNWSEAHGINSSGEIVGASNSALPDRFTAFLWANGRMSDLGTLGGNQSGANDINSSGTIVGSSTVDPTDPFTRRAFITINGVMTDLNLFLPADSGWELLAEAFAINDRGQIVGLGYKYGDTRRHGFVMSPASRHEPEERGTR
jgi:probable HAF family extracellular repeat protein